MSIQCQCPSCSKAYTVPDAALGKKATCQDCGERFRLRDGPGASVSGEQKARASVASAISKREFSGLPKWARVAFAAHCSELILEFLQFRRSDLPSGYVNTCQRAVGIAKLAAANGKPMSATNTVQAIDELFASFKDQYDPARIGAVSAAWAARSAETKEPGNAEYEAWRHANQATERLKGGQNLAEKMQRDFRSLWAESKRQGWRDDQPIRPDYFRKA
jgi:hypothetical protein